MNIYYYANNDRNADYDKLADLFVQSWSSHGWTPIAITDADCQRGYRYAEVDVMFDTYPTVNSPAYERRCMIRLCHMANVGGIVMDVDVMNYGLVPMVHNFFVPVHHLLALDEVLGFSGSRTGFSWFLDRVLAWRAEGRGWPIEQGDPHFSDMHAFIELRVPRFVIGKIYGQQGWETAPLVHYTTNSTPANISKPAHILSVRSPFAR